MKRKEISALSALAWGSIGIGTLPLLAALFLLFIGEVKLSVGSLMSICLFSLAGIGPMIIGVSILIKERREAKSPERLVEEIMSQQAAERQEAFGSQEEYQRYLERSILNPAVLRERQQRRDEIGRVNSPWPGPVQRGTAEWRRAIEQINSSHACRSEIAIEQINSSHVCRSEIASDRADAADALAATMELMNAPVPISPLDNPANPDCVIAPKLDPKVESVEPAPAPKDFRSPISDIEV